MLRLPRQSGPADLKQELAIDREVAELPERVQFWLSVGTCNVTGQTVMLYRGPDLAAAKAMAAEHKGEVIDGGMVWPPPALAKRCLCAADHAKQQMCPWGHPGECHYPFVCGSADCCYINRTVGGEADPLASMIMVLDSDVCFSGSADEGSPGCVCSRCGELIAGEAAVRCQEIDGGEFRFHRSCIGL